MEAGAAAYIEKALKGGLKDLAALYKHSLTAVDAYATATYGAAYTALAPDQQDEVLADIQSGKATGSRLGRSSGRSRSTPCRGCSATRSTAATRGSPAGTSWATPACGCRCRRVTRASAWRCPSAHVDVRRRPVPQGQEGGPGMSTRLKKTDVVIIGLGAAGGYASLALTRAGAHVVGLKAGPRLDAEDYPMDEMRNDVRDRLVARRSSPRSCRPGGERDAEADRTGVDDLHDERASAARPSTTGWSSGATCRGTSTSARRRSSATARARSRPTRRWPTGRSATTTSSRTTTRSSTTWGPPARPGTSRARGRRRQLVRGAAPPRVPAAAPAPSGWTRAHGRAAKRLGWHPFPGPAAIRSEPYDGLPACKYCGFCTYNGCMADAKGATDVGAIAEAEKTERLKIVTGARVTKIEVDGDGRATGATFVRGGEDVLPARRRGDPLAPTSTRTRACCCCRRRRRSRTGSPTTPARSASTTSATSTAA